MHPADIKASLNKRGKSLTSMAVQTNVSLSLVYQVVNSLRRTDRIRLAIALAISLPIDAIWDDEEAGPQHRLYLNIDPAYREMAESCDLSRVAVAS